MGIRVPLAWTELSPGNDACSVRARFTADSLLELTGLVESLGSDRTRDFASAEEAGSDPVAGPREEETREANAAVERGVGAVAGPLVATATRRESR